MARKPNTNGSTANIGFEQKLWIAADKLRSNMDAAEYSRAERDNRSEAEIAPHTLSDKDRGKLPKAARRVNAEAANQYKAENVFWVPKEGRWSHLQGSAKLPTIGKAVDDAMVAIERDNPRLKGVLPKDYARPGLDTARRDSALSPREATPQSLPRQRDIRRALIEADLVDCMAALPGRLFYSTQIPVCLWFEGKNSALDYANDACLFDGEAELSLVA